MLFITPSVIFNSLRTRMVTADLPYFTSGIVTAGFGRGSKELGIPTANYSEKDVNNFPDTFQTGVYYGWAQVDKGPVYKMVMSVGWNPFYKNEKKSFEVHILHKFDEHFYGSLMKICILNYLREEKDFVNLDELIKAINCDINFSDKELDKPEYTKYKEHEFFN